MLPNNARNSAMSPFGTTTTGILPNDDGTSNNPMMLEDINLMDDDQNSSDGEASIAYEQLRFTERGLLDDYDLDFSTEDLFNEGSSVSSENVRDNNIKSSQMIGDRNLGAAASNTTPASSIAGAGGMMLNNASAPSGGPQQNKKSKKKKIAGSAAVSSSSHRNTSNNSSLSSPLALTASAASPHLGNATAVGSGQNINASSNTTSSNVSSPMMLHQQQVTMRNIYGHGRYYVWVWKNASSS